MLGRYTKNFRNNFEHVAKCGINKQHRNNNMVERLNGTLRERVKVQREWKTHKSAIAEGQRIYYNFIKPHQALDEKSPVKKWEQNKKQIHELFKK